MTVSAWLSSAASEVGELRGIIGFAARIIDSLGELGVGILALIETVFPPITSEVILALAGLLAQQGEMSLVLVLIASTAGAYGGALVLYLLGRWWGEERTIRALSRLPLVDEEDFRHAARWLRRHGRSAVFFGRLLPGVRSLISLPAGSTSMPLGTFSMFTIAGSAVWNGLLIGLGALLGTQFELIDRYSDILDIVIWAALGGVVLWLVMRRIRRARQGRAS